MRNTMKKWAATDPPRDHVDDEDGAVRVPLLLRTGVEKDSVVLDVLRRLQRAWPCTAELTARHTGFSR